MIHNLIAFEDEIDEFVLGVAKTSFHAIGVGAISTKLEHSRDLIHPHLSSEIRNIANGISRWLIHTYPALIFQKQYRRYYPHPVQFLIIHDIVYLAKL